MTHDLDKLDMTRQNKESMNASKQKKNWLHFLKLQT